MRGKRAAHQAATRGRSWWSGISLTMSPASFLTCLWIVASSAAHRSGIGNRRLAAANTGQVATIGKPPDGSYS